MLALLFNALFSAIYVAVGILWPDYWSPYIWAGAGFHAGMAIAVLMFMFVTRDA